MIADLRHFGGLIWGTLVDPATMAARIMQRSYDRGTLWMGVLLVSCLSVMLVVAVGAVSATEMPMGFTPAMYGLVMTCILIILTMGIYLTGLALGGTSTFPHAFAMVIWLEMTALCLRGLQAVLGLFNPNLAAMVSIIGIAALARVFLVFVNETHQFDSLPRALATVVIAILGIGFGFGFFLALIGVSV